MVRRKDGPVGAGSRRIAVVVGRSYSPVVRDSSGRWEEGRSIGCGGGRVGWGVGSRRCSRGRTW